MGENTAIEWCDHTFNCWVGCTKVSPACDFCYAEGWAKRTGHPELWAGERRRTSAANWQKPIKWNAQAATEGRRYRVFCASLADVFDNQVPTRWRDDLWHRIEQTPNLDWLLLTKRPQNIAKMLPDPRTGTQPWGGGWPNVWLGTTTENQEEFDRRYPHIAAIPAKVHFISYEPALGPLSIRDAYPVPDWIIAGGESGAGARPAHPDWFRAIRDECRDAGVAFHFKQWGDWASTGDVGFGDSPRAETMTFRTGQMVETFGGSVPVAIEMRRVGKRAAGRLLDGREWNEYPGEAA